MIGCLPSMRVPRPFLAFALVLAVTGYSDEAHSGVGVLHFVPTDENFRQLLPKELIIQIRSAEKKYP